jgi:hypothetical protein
MRLTGSLRVPVIRYVLNCILKRKAQIGFNHFRACDGVTPPKRLAAASLTAAYGIVAARVPKIGRRLATFEGY